jgi:hypothetical protein
MGNTEPLHNSPALVEEAGIHEYQLVVLLD